MNQLYKILFTALLCCATIGSPALGMNGQRSSKPANTLFPMIPQETVNQTYARLLKARDIAGLEAFKAKRPSWANAIDEDIAHIRKEQTEAEMEKIRDAYAQLVRNEDLDGIQQFKVQYEMHPIMTQDAMAVIQYDIAQIHKVRAERAKQLDAKIRKAITKIHQLENPYAQISALLKLNELAPNNEAIKSAYQEVLNAAEQENNDQALYNDSDSDDDDRQLRASEATEQQKKPRI